VKVLLDTSVIVAAIIEAHPRHEESLLWLQKVKNNEIEGVISSHTSIELYCVLTSLPLSPRISPALAWQLIRENIFKSFELITYTKNDQISLLQRLVENQITGGASYDGLIAYAPTIGKSVYSFINKFSPPELFILTKNLVFERKVKNCKIKFLPVYYL